MGCRNLEIEKREEKWEQEENTRLIEIHKEAKETSEARQAKLAQEKALKCEEFRQECAARAEKQRRNDDINRKRQEHIRRKEEERVARAALQAQELKQDAVAKS